MDPEHKLIIKKAIEDLFKFQDKVREFKINNDFALLVAQLDFFKVISTIVVALAGIGYFYDSNLDKKFLGLSLVASLLVLLLSTSYVRENIDSHAGENQKIYEFSENETNIGIEKAVEAIEKDEANIFFDYAKNRTKNKEKVEPPSNCMGEIIVFLFYLSLGFLILSYFSKKYNFFIISFQTWIVLFFSYVLSFWNWAIKTSKLISKKLFIKK